MNNNQFLYTLELYGEDFTKKFGESGRYILEQHHCRSLYDAFDILLRIDPQAFDQNLAALAGLSQHYITARIAPSGHEDSLLEVMRISFEDSPEGEPFPGIYLQVPNDMAELESKLGIDLSDFQTYDPGGPFLLLARYKFDELLEAVVDPALLQMQKQLRSDDSLINSRTADWQYKLRIQNRHQEDELTVQIGHNLKQRGELVSDDYYYFSELRDAFFYMLDMDFRALDLRAAADNGLGYVTEQIYIAEENKIWVGVAASINAGTSYPENKNGVYLNFHTSIPDFEKAAGMDLSGLSHYNDGQAYQQILSVCTDAPELIIQDSFRRVYCEANGASLDQVDGAGRYLAVAPFVLRLEWDISPVDTKTDYRKVDDRPFVSQYSAFSALLELDCNLFYPEHSLAQQRREYIKNAAVYDSANPRPIWSKFLPSSEDGLPVGVYVRLHDNRVTFASLQMTMQRFSSIAPAEGIHILFCQSPEQPDGKHSELRWRPRPPGRSGPSL